MHPGRVIAYLSDWVHFQITRVQLWSYGLTKRSTPRKCSSRNVCFALFTPIFYFAGRRCTCCQSATPFTGGLAISTNPIPRSGLSIGDISLLRHLHQNNSAAGSNWRHLPLCCTRSSPGICLRGVKVGKLFALYLLYYLYLFWISTISSSHNNY